MRTKPIILIAAGALALTTGIAIAVVGSQSPTKASSLSPNQQLPIKAPQGPADA